MGNVNVHVSANNPTATNTANSTGPQVVSTQHGSPPLPVAAPASTAPSARREGDSPFIGAAQHDPVVPPPAYEVSKTSSLLSKEAFVALPTKSALSSGAHEAAAKRRPGRPRKDGTENKSSHPSGKSRDATPHGQTKLFAQKSTVSAAVSTVPAPSSSSPTVATGQEQPLQSKKKNSATLLSTQEAVTGHSHANATANTALPSDSLANRDSHSSDANGDATAENMDIEKQKRTRTVIRVISSEAEKQSLPSAASAQQRDPSPSALSDDSVSEIDEAEYQRTKAHKRSKKDSHDPNAPDTSMAERDNAEQPTNTFLTQSSDAPDEPAMQTNAVASDHDEDEIKQEIVDSDFKEVKSKHKKRRKQVQPPAPSSPSSPSSADSDRPLAPAILSAKAELLHGLNERFKARYCPASDAATGVEITVKGLIQRADFIPFITNTFSYVGYVGDIRREQNVHNLFALLLYKYKPGTKEANAYSADFDPFIQTGVDTDAADLCKIRYTVLAAENAAKSICIRLQYTNEGQARKALDNFSTVFNARADKYKCFCNEILVKPLTAATNRHDIMQARLVGVDRALMKHSDESIQRLIHQEGLNWEGCVAREIVGNTNRGLLVTCSPDQLALLAYLQKQAPNLMGPRMQMYFCNSSGLCFKCHSHMHILKKCPHRLSKQVKACLDCGVVGHSTGECTDTAAKSSCRWCRKHKRRFDHRVKECPFLTRNRETRIDMDALAAVHARAMTAAAKAASSVDQAMDADAAARGDEPAPIQLSPPRKPLSYAAIVRNLRPAVAVAPAPAKSTAAKPSSPKAVAAAAEPLKPSLTIYRTDSHKKPPNQPASQQGQSPTNGISSPHPSPAGSDPALLSNDAIQKLLTAIRGLEALLPVQVQTLLKSVVTALESPASPAEPVAAVPLVAAPQPPSDLPERQALEAKTRARLNNADSLTKREQDIIKAAVDNPTALSLAVIKGAHERNVRAPPHRSFLLAPSNFDVQSEEEAKEKLVIGPSAQLPGERGVFARVDLPADQAVCQYSGVLIRDKEYAESIDAKTFPSIESEFPMTPIMSLNGHDGFPHTSIYGHHHTLGVTINHSPDSPNCVAVFRKPDNASDIPYRIVMIHTTRPIKAGEELFIDYGIRSAPLQQPSPPRCAVCLSQHPRDKDTIVSCRGAIGPRGCGNGLHHSCGQIEPNDNGNALLCGWCLTRMLSSNSQ